jgi:hypothetical protein
MKEFEIALPRSTVKQPEPSLSSGGDCGACVLAGLTGKPLRSMYLLVDEEPKPFTIYSMSAALGVLEDQGGLDRVVEEPPNWMPYVHPAYAAFGYTALSQAPMWWAYLRLAIDAGYYGMATMSFQPVSSKPGDTYFSSNHWVMFKGCRFRWEDMPGGSRGKEEILVSCSVKGDYWIEVREFARLHGGAQLMLARPLW